MKLTNNIIFIFQLGYFGPITIEMDETVAQPMLSYDSISRQLVGGQERKPHPPLKTAKQLLDLLESYGPVENLPHSVMVVVANAVSAHLTVCPLIMQSGPCKGEGHQYYLVLIDKILSYAMKVGLLVFCFSMDGDSRMRANIHNIMTKESLLERNINFVSIDHPLCTYGAPIKEGLGPFCFIPDPEHVLKNQRNFLTNFLIFGNEHLNLLQLERLRLLVDYKIHGLGLHDLNHMVIFVCFIHETFGQIMQTIFYINVSFHFRTNKRSSLL